MIKLAIKLAISLAIFIAILYAVNYVTMHLFHFDFIHFFLEGLKGIIKAIMGVIG